MSHLLLKAASTGDVATVRRLLDSGVDINYHSKDKQATGRTALSEAAIQGHLEVVRLLLERGANLDWQDRAVGFTPLGWAANEGHESIVEALLEAGADPNVPTPEFLHTPLMAAAQRGSLPDRKAPGRGRRQCQCHDVRWSNRLEHGPGEEA